MKARMFLCAALVLSGGLFIAGCEKGPAEKAGQKIDEGAKKVGDAAKDAGNKVKDAATGK